MKTGVVLLYLSGSAPALGAQFMDAGVGDPSEYGADAGLADSSEHEADAGVSDTKDEAVETVATNEADADSSEAFDEWDAYVDEDNMVYETEVVGYRLRPTDKVTGFGETIEVIEKRKSVSNVSEVLSRSVGVQVRTMGGLGSYGAASVRGSTPSQVPVFLDGIQLNIGGFSVVNLGDFSLDTLESIEVYRGNAPLYLGTGGIGGAIVLRTRTLEESVNEYAASYGSWNTWRLLTLYGARAGKLDALVIVSGQHSDGDFRYYNRNGTFNTTDDDQFVARTNNDHTAQSALLKLSHPLGRWDALLMDDLFYKSQGLAGVDHMVEKSDAALDTLRNTVNLRFERSIGRKSVLDLDFGHLYMFERFHDMSGTIGTGHQDHEYRTHGASGAALLVTKFSPKHTTTFRLAERYERFDEHRRHQSPENQQSPSHRLRTEIGMEYDFAPITSIHVVPTLRTEIHYSYFGGGATPELLTDFEATSKTDYFLSPSLGVRYEVVEGLQLRANGGRYTRTPDLSELFGDRGAVIGNPDLKAEVGNNLDAGATYILMNKSVLDLLRVDAVWFGSWVEDLISFEQNSQSTTRPVNIDAARVLGTELGLQLGLFDLVNLSGNYTYFHGVNRSKIEHYRGKKLPGKPTHEVYGRLDLGKTFPRWGIGGWFDVDLADKAYVGQYNAEDFVTMHFFLGLGARFELPKTGFSFTFEVKNLTDNLVFKNDEGAWLPMSDYNRYPLPGRTFLGTIYWRRP